MKVLTCFLLFRIFASQAQDTPQNKRSVNLNLETVLEFGNKDNSADVKFLDNVQNFISKVKTVIHKKKSLRRVFQASKLETLTDFILEVIHIVDKYDDATFKDFFEILDEEVRKYHYRGCKFYELTENLEIRKFMADNLNLIKGKSVLIVKTFMNVLADVLKNESYDKHAKELLNHINSLYIEDARQKFNDILNDLDVYKDIKSKKSKANLVKIIRDGIRSIIFDHYTDLNTNARRELKDKIETFWRHYKHNSSETTEPDNFLKVDSRHFKNGQRSTVSNQKFIKVINSASKTHKYEPMEEEISKKRIEIKQSDYKNINVLSGNRNGRMKEQVKYTKVAIYDKGQKTKVTFRKAADVYLHTTAIDSQLSISSSSEGDLTDETLENNSIDIYQKHQQDMNTQRYMTLYPEGITYKRTRESENIEIREHRSEKQIKKKRPKVNTLWVEEITSRVPQAFIEKRHRMNTKKRHGNNNQKYDSSPGSKRWLKREWKEYKTEDNKRHEQKQTSKHKHKKDTVHQSHQKSGARSEISRLIPMQKRVRLYQKRAFMEVKTAKDNKNMGPSGIEKEIEPSTVPNAFISTIAPLPSRKPVRTKSPRIPLRHSVSTVYPDLTLRLGRRPKIYLKYKDHLPSQKKPPRRLWITASQEKHGKRYEVIKKNTPRARKHAEHTITHKEYGRDRSRNIYRRQNENTTKSNTDADINLIKRLKDLEKELKEVKNRMTREDTVAPEQRNVTDSYMLKEKVEKIKNVDVNDKNSGENYIHKVEAPVKSVVLKTEHDNIATMRVTDLPHITTGDNKTATRMNQTANVLNNRVKDDREKIFKLMVGDDRLNFGFDDKNDNPADIGLMNYGDEDNVWKDHFTLDLKPSTKSTTKITPSFDTTAVKTTKKESVSLITEKFQSVPQRLSASYSNNTANNARKDININYPIDNVPNKNNTTNIPHSTKDIDVAKQIKNITNNLLKELKKETDTVTTTAASGFDYNPLNTSPFDINKEKALPNSSPQTMLGTGSITTLQGLPFTDPFDSIDEDILMPKIPEINY